MNVLAGALLWLPAFASLGGEAAAFKAPRNILFILTDDHRPDGLGCYGNKSIRTPNFDSIASEGVRLDAFYLASPLCCPSRAVFLSGLYPHQSDILDNGAKGANQSLPANWPSVATLLNRAGYCTGFIGKAHLTGDPRKWDFKEVPLWLPRGGSPHKDPQLMVAGQSKKVPGHITQIFIDEAMAWVEKHKGERWFLWLATTSPHAPYLRDPNHPYELANIKPPPLWPAGEALSDAKNFTGYDAKVVDWVGYYSTISMLDEQIGRLLKKLKELGTLDETFVFVAGDNGMMIGSHAHAEKWIWFEESARSVSLARYPPLIKAGAAVSSPIVSVDLYPTLCELAGVAPPDRREGVSMLPALTGKEPLRKTVHSEVRMPKPFQGEGQGASWQMVQSEAIKYVWFDDGKELLYDRSTDPHEFKDRSKEPEQAGTMKRMRELRQKWLDATPRIGP